MTQRRNRPPWDYEQKVRDFLRPGVRRLDIAGGKGPDTASLEDGSFDLITIYQQDYDLREIVRLLRQDGFFVTQQIGGRNRPEAPDFNLENQVPLLEAAGFRLVYCHQAYYVAEPGGALQHRFIMVGKKRRG